MSTFPNFQHDLARAVLHGSSPRPGPAPTRRAHAGDGHPQHHPRLVRRRRLHFDMSSAPSRRACGWWRTAPTSSTSAASRRGRAPTPLPEAEELRRVHAGHRAARRARPVPISIDTYKASGRARGGRAPAPRSSTTSAGCSTIRGSGAVAAETGAALVLMHTRGRSSGMYDLAVYDDAAAEVARELGEADRARAAARRRVARRDHPRSGPRVREEGGAQLRRSWRGSTRSPRSIGRSCRARPASRSSRPRSGSVDPSAREWGTAAAVTASVLLGAHIVRVHGVQRDGRRRRGSARPHR